MATSWQLCGNIAAGLAMLLGILQADGLLVQIILRFFRAVQHSQSARRMLPFWPILVGPT